jgi:acyl-CoA synthetase (AMP-forming)/AMP-acid ligase II
VIFALAVLRAGAIGVAVNVMLGRDELAYVLSDSGCRALLCEEGVAGRALAIGDRVPSLELVIVPEGCDMAGTMTLRRLIEGAPTVPVVPRGPDDIAFLVYTSGTTGAPKGVMMTHAFIDFVVMSWVVVFKFRHSDRMFLASPFFYTMGMISVLIAFRVGAPIVLAGRFQARAALDAIAAHRVTGTWIVPTAAAQLMDAYEQERDDLSSMTRFFVAGDSLREDLRARLDAVLPGPPRETYGLTEAHVLGASAIGMALRDGMIGPPGGNVDLRLVDDEGSDVQVGEVGEILCKGDTVVAGYWQRPEETRKAFRDGWFATGDLGVQDDYGYLKVVGRKNSMIVTGGANVYPAEVEKALLKHAGLMHAVVVGIPDKIYGELPVAGVVPRPGAILSEDEVLAFCRENLAAYKCPRRVLFADSLPVTATGKLSHRAFRDQILAGDGSRRETTASPSRATA